MLKVWTRGICAIGIMLVSASTSAQAAGYPDHAVHLYVGSAPGGGADILTRLIGQRLSEKWGQPVVVEDEPGAVGAVAADKVAHAPADGYTLMMASTNHTVTPSLQKIPYDPINSFTPITEVAYLPDIMVVNPSVPVHTVNEFIALAKAKPGQLNYGSSEVGSPGFLEMELLKKLANINVVGVGYKGTAPATVALLSNEVQVLFGSVSATLAQIKGGKIRAITVASGERLKALPEIPTISEAAGLKGFESVTWNEIIAPAGLPKDVASKLHDDIVSIVKSPDIKEKLLDQGYIGVGNSSTEFAALIKGDISKWGGFLADIPKQ